VRVGSLSTVAAPATASHGTAAGASASGRGGLLARSPHEQHLYQDRPEWSTTRWGYPAKGRCVYGPAGRGTSFGLRIEAFAWDSPQAHRAPHLGAGQGGLCSGSADRFSRSAEIVDSQSSFRDEGGAQGVPNGPGKTLAQAAGSGARAGSLPPRQPNADDGRPPNSQSSCSRGGVCSCGIQRNKPPDTAQQESRDAASRATAPANRPQRQASFGPDDLLR
jgi:hypothetical protein